MPPNADTGSVAKALRYAASGPSATATPHGLACLTMTQAGAFERLHAFPRGIAVADVVVRELLALELARGGDGAGHGLLVAIERRRLVRILAVAKVLHLRDLKVECVRKCCRRPVGAARGQPVRDRAVVGRRVREGLARKCEARRRRERPARRELSEQRRIVRRVDDNADVLPVLRRGAHQRRAADVDVLDRIVERASRLRHRGAERVQVDDDEVDRRDRMLLERGDVRRIVTARENAAVHLRMQRLHAPIEHFRKAGVIADLRHREAGVGERVRGAASRQEPDAELREAAREVDDPGLVGHGQQGLRARVGHGNRQSGRGSAQARRRKRGAARARFLARPRADAGAQGSAFSGCRTSRAWCAACCGSCRACRPPASGCRPRAPSPKR